MILLNSHPGLAELCESTWLDRNRSTFGRSQYQIQATLISSQPYTNSISLFNSLYYLLSYLALFNGEILCLSPYIMAAVDDTDIDSIIFKAGDYMANVMNQFDCEAPGDITSVISIVQKFLLKRSFNLEDK